MFQAVNGGPHRQSLVQQVSVDPAAQASPQFPHGDPLQLSNALPHRVVGPAAGE